jgi:hypothetical protein
MRPACDPARLVELDVRKFRGIDDVIDAAEPWPYTDLDFVFAEHQKETPKAFASRRR